MDFARDLHTNLWKLPRGVKRDDRVGGGLSWTAKYGSVVAGVYDIISADGVNEKGLAGHVLWLAESDYGTPDPARPQLAMSVWMQYYLDNFATDPGEGGGEDRRVHRLRVGISTNPLVVSGQRWGVRVIAPMTVPPK